MGSGSFWGKGAVIIKYRDQCRIIHEAGEAEASGPGPGPPGTTKIYKVGPLWARNFYKENLRSSKMLA